jgi:hypothetical protein
MQVVEMDTSKVVNPVEHLRGEIKGLGNTIDEIDGNIATLYVQKARISALRDALVAGVQALHGGEEMPDPS